MLYECPCLFDAVCFSEDVGFFHITSNGVIGDVRGLFKSDINIKGMRFACGLTWYAGNYEIGGMIKRGEDYIELIKMDAVDFFDNSDVKNGNVALLGVATLGDYYVYVAAVAYMGGNSFLFASRVFNVAQVWKEADIFLPKNTGIMCIDKKEIKVEDYDYTKSYKVRNTRIITKQSEARKELFKIVKKDLEALNVKVPGKDENNQEIEIVDMYPYTLKDNYFISESAAYFNADKILDISPQIDLSNVFSNYIFLCWTPKGNCAKAKCHILKKEDDDTFLLIPESIGVLMTSSIVVDKNKQKKVATDILINKFTKIWDVSKWTDYFLVVPDGKESSFYINTPNKNLLEYKEFIVPAIPEDTLAGQNEEIDSIVGISKIITYKKA